MGLDLDRCIEQLRQCEPLKESEVKQLCQLVRARALANHTRPQILSQSCGACETFLLCKGLSCGLFAFALHFTFLKATIFFAYACNLLN